MTTLEQKKSEIEMFLSEREATKRLKLEQIISGRRGRIDYIVPVTMTALSMGGLIWLGASGSLDVLAVLLLFVLTIMNTWTHFESTTVNKQIKALKGPPGTKRATGERG